MTQNFDFDVQAAWHRRFKADVESNLKAFALRLKEAMPELVTVQETRGFCTFRARYFVLAGTANRKRLTGPFPSPRLGTWLACSARASAEGGFADFALARTVTPRSQFAALLWPFSVGEYRWRDLRDDQRIPWRFQSVFRHLAGGSATFHFGKRDLAARS